MIDNDNERCATCEYFTYGEDSGESNRCLLWGGETSEDKYCESYESQEEY